MGYIIAIIVGFVLLQQYGKYQAESEPYDANTEYKNWLSDPKPTGPPDLENPLYFYNQYSGYFFTRIGGWRWDAQANNWVRTADPRTIFTTQAH